MDEQLTAGVSQYTRKALDVDASFDGGDYLTTSPSFPRQMGRYEIIYPISHGGMASVFAGRLTGLAGFQRLVAIKIIHPHLSSQQNFIEMFLDEARLAACIHHPNVGEVYEVGEENGVYYMVCELVLGQSLNELAVRAREMSVRISPAFYAKVVSFTALALQAAHELRSPEGQPLQLVHRDVSTRNILLSYDGFVKLIDFGVAYAADRVSHTDTGTLKGKLGYMSPEQVKGQSVDRRSDIFSLGVVLYKLTTGRMPFGGKSEADRLYRIVTYQFESPRRIEPNVPEALERIILRAMAFAPEERYDSAADMSAELEGFIKTSGETVDTGLLSGTMHSLFSEEREHHLLKVRNIGSSANWKPPAAASYDLTKMMPVRPQSQSGDRREPHVWNIVSSVTEFLNTPGNKVLAAVILSIVVVGFFFVFRSVQAPEHSARVSVSQSAPDDASVASIPLENPQPTGSEVVAGSVASSAEVNISFALSPSDATVKLDDVAVASGTQSLQLSADGRPHRITVTADGYIPVSKTITADTDWELEISLSPDPAYSIPSEPDNTLRRNRHRVVRNQKRTDTHPPGRSQRGHNQGSTGDALSKVRDSSDTASPLLQESPYQ